MATGSYDANGIWNYGEDDNIALFSDTLNKLADSTSDAFTSDRSRLSTLEAGSLSGLIPVKPATVTVATGTASVNTLGVVTFTGATAISLNNVFSLEYTHYKVMLRLDNSSAGNTACLRMRTAGTDDSSANYNRAGYYINVGGSLTGWTAASQTLLSVVNMDVFTSGTMFAFAELTIANPKMTTRTIVNSTALGRDSIGAWQNTTSNAVNNAATSYDGFTFFPNGAGTFGGTIQVFGYND